MRTYSFVKNKTKQKQSQQQQKRKQTNKNSKYTCPQGEKAPPGFNLWLQTQYRLLRQNMAPGSEPHWSERSPKSWGLPQLSSKATTETQGFIPRHRSNSENESLVGRQQENIWAEPQTIQRASQKFLREDAEHPGSEPDAEGPRGRSGGRASDPAGRGRGYPEGSRSASASASASAGAGGRSRGRGGNGARDPAP